MKARREAASAERPLLLFIALLTVALLLLVSGLYVLPPTTSEAAWKAHRVLLVDAGVAESEVLDRLGAHGFRGVISESTQPVQISDWVGLVTTTLGDLQTKLMPADPRRDDYLSRLEGWFRAWDGDREYRVYYLPRILPFGLAGSVEQALAGLEGRFLLPENERRVSGIEDRIGTATALLFLLALLAGESVKTKAGPRGRFGATRLVLRSALMTPWLALACFASPASLLALVWGAAFVETGGALVLPLAEYRKSRDFSTALRSCRRAGRPPYALFLVGAGLLLLFPAYLATLLLLVAASLCSLLALAVSPHFLRSPGRTGFVPLPLGVSASSPHKSLAAAASVTLGIVLMFLAHVLSPASGSLERGEVRFPVPVPIAASLRPGPREARQEIQREDRNSLPLLADWLAHRARQEALPYLVLGEAREDPFAPVSLPKPDGPATTIAFGEDWAKAAYRSLMPASVEALLSSQGRAVRAELRDRLPPRGRPLAPIEIILYIILLIPPLWRIIAAMPAVRDSSTRELRQEA